MSCIIIEIVFCSSQLFASMQSPVSNKLTGRKRSLSVNESPIATIKDLIKSNKDLKSPEALILANNLGRLQESGGGSKQKVSRSVAHFAESQLLDERDKNLEQANNQLFGVYTDSVGKRKKSIVLAMECAVKNLPIEEQPQYFAVDTNHVLYPRPIKDYATNRCIGISGGHNIDQYLVGELDTLCILTQNKKLGVFVNIDGNGKVKKTCDYDIEGRDVIKVVKKSTFVATTPGNKDSLRIVRTSKGDFYGTYIDENNPLICKTQFPLLTADRDVRDKQGDVIIATLANLTKNYKNIQNEKTLSVSLQYFDNIMQNSPLQMYVKDIAISDITKEIEHQFQSVLVQRGYHQGHLPGRIYAVRKINP